MIKSSLFVMHTGTQRKDYMCTVPFKEKVKNAAIKNAPLYKDKLMGYEYLVCSEAFGQGCHIIKADKGNYLHLIGIHTALTPDKFFDKCMGSAEKQLTEDDFDFSKPGRSEKSVKGSVRQKIAALPNALDLFKQSLWAEDNFKKNEVSCAFAAADNNFTLGFAVSGRPKSLLKGNELNKGKQREVDLVFRKPRGSGTPYEELVYGNIQKLYRYKVFIETLISDAFWKE